MIGTDDKSNISNYKYTNLVEICPLCKDDLIYLPARTARSLGNISQLVIVKGISNLIHFLDPLSGQTASMTAEMYWREPLRPVVTAARSRMTRFIVLGKEPVVLERNVSKRQATRKQRNRLASITMAREDDLGVNDKQFEERSHVGYLMKSGDVCVGYDLTETQFVDDDAEDKKREGKLPDVIILRKLYGGVATGDANAAKMRIWQLQRLDVEMGDATLEANTKSKGSRKSKNNEAEADDIDEEDFMREVEADREMRGQMNLYKSEVAKKKESDGGLLDNDSGSDNHDDGDDEDDQEVKLDELLDGLVLDSGPDAEDMIAGNTAGAGANAAISPPQGQQQQDHEEAMIEEFFAEGEKAAKDGIAYVGRDDARHLRDKETAVPLSEFGKEFAFLDDKDL